MQMLCYIRNQLGKLTPSNLSLAYISKLRKAATAVRNLKE